MARHGRSCLLAAAFGLLPFALAGPAVARTPQDEKKSDASQAGAQLEPVDSRYFKVPTYDRYGRRSTYDIFSLTQTGEYPITGSAGLLDPYNVNPLKGDEPIWGENLFLRVDGVSASILDHRDVAGVSKTDTEIKTDQFLSFDLQYGDTVFRPPSFRVRVTGAFDYRQSDVVTNDKSETDESLQEFFGEALLAEFDPSFDFLSLRVGRQAFASDFRKFIFADVNDGARLFGSWAANRVQYDLAGFDLVEKDKFSNLNRTSEDRQQHIATADVFVQDAFWRGYTVEGTALWVDDQAAQDVNILYLGCNGQGHIGPVNVAHVLYEAVGKDDQNPIAGRATDVNAQLAALELAVPCDWYKWIVSGLYASGDADAGDGRATGFDGVFDAPDFAGGAFGFWDRENFVIGGKRLKNGNSFYPNLRTKNFNAPNAVNPGLLLLNAGWDGKVSNFIELFANATWLRFVKTDSLEQQFNVASVRRDIGVDLSIGAQYRPLGIDNIIFTGGFAALVPGEGLRDIAGSGTLFGSFITMTLAF